MGVMEKRKEMFKELIIYIWVRDVSKRYFDVDFDPENTDEEVANMFNRLNIYCENFDYTTITKIVAKKLENA